MVKPPASLRLSPQRRSRPDGLLHRHRRHAGAHQARKDGGHLRPRDAHALPAELHGADRGPVQLHPRRAAGSGGLRQHRGGGEEPVFVHPEAGPGGERRARHRHGARVQGSVCRALT